MQNKSNRKRKRCNLSRFDKEINQAKEKKKGIKETQILNFLKCAPSFIGCFAEDEVRLLSVQTTPAYLIVNVDDSSLPGSHWIAIGIFDSRIEIFDTLGFNFFLIGHVFLVTCSNFCTNSLKQEKCKSRNVFKMTLLFFVDFTASFT